MYLQLYFTVNDKGSHQIVKCVFYMYNLCNMYYYGFTLSKIDCTYFIVHLSKMGWGTDCIAICQPPIPFQLHSFM